MKKIMLILVILVMQFTNIYAGENEFVTKWTAYYADSNYNLLPIQPAQKLVFTINNGILKVDYNNHKNIWTFHIDSSLTDSLLFKYDEKHGDYYGYTLQNSKYVVKSDIKVISLCSLNKKRALMFLSTCKHRKTWKWEFTYFVLERK